MRVSALLVTAVFCVALTAQKPSLSQDEKAIQEQERGLRSLPDDTRAVVTKRLANAIRQLPLGANKLMLAMNLSGLSTEGDFGRDTLQAVANTLAEAIQEQRKA